MYEYIYFYGVIPFNESLNVIGIKNNPPQLSYLESTELNYKALRVLRDDCLSKLFIVYISHERNDIIEHIVEGVKAQIKGGIDSCFQLKTTPSLYNQKNIGMIYGFDIAPKYDRWDITGITTHNTSDHALKIVKNLKEAENCHFLYIKKLVEPYDIKFKKKILNNIYKYIDKQKNIALKRND